MTPYKLRTNGTLLRLRFLFKKKTNIRSLTRHRHISDDASARDNILYIITLEDTTPLTCPSGGH